MGDGPDGDIIGEFSPSRTGSWDVFEDKWVAIDQIDGVHDLTFVGKDANWIWKMKSFDLSEDLFFEVSTDYKVDDQESGKRDVQCTYDVVLHAFTTQVYDRYYFDSGSTAEDKFYDELGVNSPEAAAVAVNNLCVSAQEAIEQVPFEDITYNQGPQFIELYYAGRASWNEETETHLFPGNETTAYQVLKDDAYKVNEYKAISEKSIFEMPNLAQFDPAMCASHAAQCCWPRDRQAGDNNGNCESPYDSDCVDKDVADNTDLCYNELDKAPC